MSNHSMGFLLYDIINFSGHCDIFLNFNLFRGRPLDILGEGGGGGSDPKKKITQGIELEKNSCKRLKKEKKFVQPHEIG